MVGQPYDDRTNASIELLLKCNITPKSIAEDLQSSLNQIYRKKQRLKVFGTVNLLPLIGVGRPRFLTIEYEEAMVDFLNEYPEIYFNEIIVFIADEFDFVINRNIISKAFKHIKIIYKRVESVYDM
jgi:transposase